MLNTLHISGIRGAIFTFTIDSAFFAGFARFNKQCFGLSNETAKDKNFDCFAPDSDLFPPSPIYHKLIKDLK